MGRDDDDTVHIATHSPESPTPKRERRNSLTLQRTSAELRSAATATHRHRLFHAGEHESVKKSTQLRNDAVSRIVANLQQISQHNAEAKSGGDTSDRLATDTARSNMDTARQERYAEVRERVAQRRQVAGEEGVKSGLSALDASELVGQLRQADDHLDSSGLATTARGVNLEIASPDDVRKRPLAVKAEMSPPPDAQKAAQSTAAAPPNFKMPRVVEPDESPKRSESKLSLLRIRSLQLSQARETALEHLGSSSPRDGILGRSLLHNGNSKKSERSTSPPSQPPLRPPSVGFTSVPPLPSTAGPAVGARMETVPVSRKDEWEASPEQPPSRRVRRIRTWVEQRDDEGSMLSPSWEWGRRPPSAVTEEAVVPPGMGLGNGLLPTVTEQSTSKQGVSFRVINTDQASSSAKADQASTWQERVARRRDVRRRFRAVVHVAVLGSRRWGAPPGEGSTAASLAAQVPRQKRLSVLQAVTSVPNHPGQQIKEGVVIKTDSKMSESLTPSELLTPVDADRGCRRLWRRLCCRPPAKSRRKLPVSSARRMAEAGVIPFVPPRHVVEKAHRERRNISDLLDRHSSLREQERQVKREQKRSKRKQQSSGKRKTRPSRDNDGPHLRFKEAVVAIPADATFTNRDSPTLSEGAREESPRPPPRPAIKPTGQSSQTSMERSNAATSHKRATRPRRSDEAFGDELMQARASLAAAVAGNSPGTPTFEDIRPLLQFSEKLTLFLQDVVASWPFGLIILVSILLNTVALAFDSYPGDENVSRVTEAINFVLSCVFLLEMVLKLIAMGPRVYASDAFNVFDATIVILSVVEVAVAPPALLAPSSTASSSSSGAVSALRTFRLLRILKLARAWVSLRVLLGTVLSSLSEVGNFAAVTLLFIIVIALFGAFTFANRFRFESKTGSPLLMTDEAFYVTDPSRLSFDDLWSSIVSVFIVLAGEKWISLWFDAWRATGWIGCVFFIIAVILLQIVLLNLFLAILLSKFEGLEEKTERARRRRRKQLRAQHAGSATGSLDDDETMTVATSVVGDSLKSADNSVPPVEEALQATGVWGLLSRTFGSLRDSNALDVAIATRARFIRRYEPLWIIRNRLAARVRQFRQARASRHLQQQLSDLSDQSPPRPHRGSVAKVFPLDEKPSDSHPRRLSSEPESYDAAKLGGISELHPRRLSHLATEDTTPAPTHHEAPLPTPPPSRVQPPPPPSKSTSPRPPAVSRASHSPEQQDSEMRAAKPSFHRPPRLSLPARRSSTPKPTAAEPNVTCCGLCCSCAGTMCCTWHPFSGTVTEEPVEPPAETSHKLPPKTATQARLVRMESDRLLVTRRTPGRSKRSLVPIDPVAQLFSSNRQLTKEKLRRHSGVQEGGSKRQIPMRATQSSRILTGAPRVFEESGSGSSSPHEVRPPPRIDTGADDQEVEAVLPFEEEDLAAGVGLELGSVMQRLHATSSFRKDMSKAMAMIQQGETRMLPALPEAETPSASGSIVSERASMVDTDSKPGRAGSSPPNGRSSAPTSSSSPMMRRSPAATLSFRIVGKSQRATRIAEMESAVMNLDAAVDITEDTKQQPMESRSTQQLPPSSSPGAEPPSVPMHRAKSAGKLVSHRSPSMTSGARAQTSKAAQEKRFVFSDNTQRGMLAPGSSTAKAAGMIAKGSFVDKKHSREDLLAQRSFVDKKHPREDLFMVSPAVAGDSQVQSGVIVMHEAQKGRPVMSDGQLNAARDVRLRELEAVREKEEEDRIERSQRAPRTVDEILERLPRKVAQAQRSAKTLFCLDIKNPLRRFSLWLVSQPRFDNVILVLIIVSSVILAIDTPLLDPTSVLASVLSIIDAVLAVSFGMEMMLKIFAWGLVMHKGAYLRNAWNVLDGTLVILTFLSLASTEFPTLRSLRSLRAFRALRPLRVIARNDGMRVVVNALFSALPSILNVFVVFMLFILIFAIVGVGLLKGTMNACQGPMFDSLPTERQYLIAHPRPYSALTPMERGWSIIPNATFPGATSKVVCLWMGAQWQPTTPVNFDNVFQGSLTLFEMSTTEGWVDVLLAGVDSRGIDMQPLPNANPAMALFFMIFILVGSFFFLNAFVGVTIDNFSRSKEGTNLATKEQKEWIQLTDAVLNTKPLKRPRQPRSATRRKAFQIVQSGWFEPFIMGCILLNAIVMAASFYGMPVAWSNILDTLNTIFAIIFTVEAALKLVALGWNYWAAAWNVFDFIVVVASVVGMLLSVFSSFSIGPVASLVRTVRVGRVIRLVKQARSLRLLFRALLVTLPGLANIASLLGLFIVIYAILGQQLFAHVKYGATFNEDANFRSFGSALLLLLRAATGEDWNALQSDLANTEDCSNNPSWDDSFPRGCGSPVAALIFFVSFTVTVSFVLLNLVVGLLLEAFSNEGVGSKLSAEQIEQFSEVWAEFDPDASGFVPANQMGSLLRVLPPPLGFGRHNDASDDAVRKRVLQLRITTWRGPNDIQGGQVQFADVMLGLGRWMVEFGGGKSVNTGPQRPSRRGSTDLPEGHPALKRLRELRRRAAEATGSERLEWDVRHALAARTVVDAYRTFRLRWRLAAAMATVQEAFYQQQMMQQQAQALEEGKDDHSPSTPSLGRSVINEEEDFSDEDDGSVDDNVGF
jgi:hypothetical protein